MIDLSSIKTRLSVPVFVYMSIISAQLTLPVSATFTTWRLYNGSCYTLSTSQTTFDGQSDQCVSLGGYLLEIDSDDEMDFIQDFLEETGQLIFIYKFANVISFYEGWKGGGTEA